MSFLPTVYHRLVPASMRRTLSLTRRFRQTRDALARHAITLVDPSVRRLQVRLRSLRGLWAGQRCVIMGNGPSLNRTDLSRLRNEFVWGVNRCYLLFDRISWRPSFYVAVDRRVVPDCADEITHLVRLLPASLFFFPLHFRTRGTLRSASNLFWYREERLKDDASAEEAFSLDVPRLVYSVRTVIVAAIQLAVHLGFNPIYLIGCDASYTVPKTVARDAGFHDRLTSTCNDDVNHFDSSYFGAGRRWHEPHVDRMVHHFELTRHVCAAQGVEILNATEGGQLEVFPRVAFSAVFPPARS